MEKYIWKSANTKTEMATMSYAAETVRDES